MIVVYNNRGEIQYSVDDPYPASMYDTYESKADNDPEFFYTVVEQTSISGKYVDTSDGAVIERPGMDLDLPALVSVGDIVIISVLPGCSVIVDEQQTVVCDDGTLTFDALEPGTYTFRFQHWPFIDFMHELTVS